MARIKWTKQLAMSEALNYTSKAEFSRGSFGYLWLQRRGYLDEACKHMVGSLKYWSEELAAKEALKYTVRKDFMSGSKGAYEYLRTRKLLDNHCTHMTDVVRWSKKKTFALAAEYTSRNKFQRDHGGAYTWLVKHSLKEEAMAHMSSHNEAKFKGTKGKTGVYLLKHKGTIIYIGRSLTCINSRLLRHCKEKEGEFDEVEVLIMSNVADTAILEVYLICRHSPKLNVDSTSKYIPTLCIRDYEQSVDTVLNFKEI